MTNSTKTNTMQRENKTPPLLFCLLTKVKDPDSVLHMGNGLVCGPGAPQTSGGVHDPRDEEDVDREEGDSRETDGQGEDGDDQGKRFPVCRFRVVECEENGEPQQDLY